VFFHNLFRGGTWAGRRNLFSLSGGIPTRPHPIRATKKAPTHIEKGPTNRSSLLIFPKPMVLELELAPVIEIKVQSVAVASPGQSLSHSL